MITEEQIERFFAKQCDAYEAEQVAAWLQAHPHLADKFLDESEWTNASSGERLTDKAYHDIWRDINRRIRKKKTVILLKRFTAAACIAGCIYLGFFYLTGYKATALVTASNNMEPTPKQAAADTFYNNTSQQQIIILPDSSVVTLMPKSFVWFITPFGNGTKRDIYLQGEARFDVAKNKEKPFTVYSGSFSTTALGTEFVVKQQNSSVRVQLYHGKVVIKTTVPAIKNWKDIYLLPGQQMTYNERDAIAKVSAFNDNKIAANKAAVKIKTPRETADSLIFDGSAMATVLEKLHAYYNVQIEYANADLKDISFTGVIVKKDSVQNILKVITQMNGLLLDNKDGAYIISKNHN